MSVGPIPIGDHASYIAMLHTAYYGNDKKVLDYVVEYEDGSKATVAINGNQQIGDWYEPKDKPACVVAWAQPHPKVNVQYGFYIYVWMNPEPDKKIAGISMVSAQGAVPIVLGISYGR